METKKHPKANLENYSKLFAQLGLVLSLAIIYVLIQSKSFTDDIALLENAGTQFIDETEKLVIYEVEPPKAEKKIKKKLTNEIIVVDDDEPIVEDVLDIIDPDEPVADLIIDDVPEPEIIEERVPFIIIEDAPVFPGCKGSQEEMKACFILNIQKFVRKNFNSDLANELGLKPGVQSIFTIFTIDTNGKIIDIKARAPHSRLQKEAIRVINMLPEMTPGMQRKKPVGVKFSLPIKFKVE